MIVHDAIEDIQNTIMIINYIHWYMDYKIFVPLSIDTRKVDAQKRTITIERFRFVRTNRIAHKIGYFSGLFIQNEMI